MALPVAWAAARRSSVRARCVRDQPFQQVRDGSVGRPGCARDECHFRCRLAGGQREQPVEHPGSDFRVRAGPVGLAVVQTQVDGQRGEVIFRQRGQEYRRQIPRVVAAIGQRQVVGAQKSKIEGYVVTHDGQVADEAGELVGHLMERGGAFNLGRADIGQLLDERRDPTTGVDEGLVAVEDLITSEPDGAQLDDGV